MNDVIVGFRKSRSSRAATLISASLSKRSRTDFTVRILPKGFQISGGF